MLVLNKVGVAGFTVLSLLRVIIVSVGPVTVIHLSQGVVVAGGRVRVGWLAPELGYLAHAQFRALRGITESFAIWAFSAEHSGFVVFPIALLPVKATISGEEEEPDRSENHGGGDKAKEEKKPIVIER